MTVVPVASRTAAPRGTSIALAEPTLATRPSSITTFELGTGSRPVPSINVPPTMAMITLQLLLAPGRSSNSTDNEVLLPALVSDLCSSYPFVEDLKRFEEVIVAPDELVARRQIYVLIIATFGKNAGDSRVAGFGRGQVALDQCPDR